MAIRRTLKNQFVQTSHRYPGFPTLADSASGGHVLVRTENHTMVVYFSRKGGVQSTVVPVRDRLMQMGQYSVKQSGCYSNAGMRKGDWNP